MLQTKPVRCDACPGSSCKPPTSSFVPAFQVKSFDQIKMAIAAESPGEQEALNKTPLCGSTGIELQTRVLTPLGIARDDVILDNLIRCKPFNNKFPLYDLGDAMTEHCGQWNTVLDLYNPDVVIMAFHPTFALIYTNQAYSTVNAVKKALRLREEGHRPLIAMGQKWKECLFPQLPGSITDWDGKHFFVEWKKRGITDYYDYHDACVDLMKPKKFSLGRMK